MTMIVQNYRPAMHGMGAWTLLGSALFWAIVAIKGNAGIFVETWPIWILILSVSILNALAYLGLRCFHLTRRIKSDQRRKRVTDFIRSWIMLAGKQTLIYAELEGEDPEDIAYLFRYLADIPGFHVRVELSVTREAKKVNVIKLFSDERISRRFSS